MFNHLAPAQTSPPPPSAPASVAPPHTVSALPPAKSEEPMDAAPSQPAPP